MDQPIQRRRFGSLATAGGLLLAAPALAQPRAYPSQPVRIVVPFETGGPTDAIARLVAGKLATLLGQPFIVENRSGANSVIGTTHVVRSAPDGYTLLIGTNGTSGSAALNPNLPYDTLRDISAVASLAVTPYFLTAAANLPVANFPEFLAYCRANPGRVTFASSGIGSGPHLAGELLKMRTGIDMVHVPYRGTAPAITDMLAGRVSVYFTSLSASLPHLPGGQLKILAVASRARSPFVPEVATLEEAGLADFTAESWFGLLAPAQIPPEAEAVLSRAVASVLDDAEVQQRFRDIVHLPLRMSSAEFKDFFRRDIEKWREVVRVARITTN
jgi:tripartite-type tricarboxylate transporter receptor subunit TctC